MADTSNYKDKVIVKTTELYRLIVRGLKLLIFIIIAGIILYIFYRIFGYLFYLSFFTSLIILFPILWYMVKAPGEHYLEFDMSEKGEMLSLAHIPYKIMNDFNKEGSYICKIPTQTGKTVTLVEKIDYYKKEIIYPWFKEMSGFQFHFKKKIFLELRKCVVGFQEEILQTKELRPIMMKTELKRSYERMRKEKLRDDLNISNLSKQV